MAMATYLGVVERGEHGLGVFFPDFAGCVSGGETLFSAMENGERALAAHIELLAQEREDLPEASCEIAVDEDVDVASYFLAHVKLSRENSPA